MSRLNRVKAWFTDRRHGWQALFVLLVVSILDVSLSSQLSLATVLFTPLSQAPRELGLVISATLFLAGGVAWVAGRPRTMRLLTSIYAGFVTAQLIYSAIGLVLTLPTIKPGAGAFRLLIDALIVWSVNVLIFAVWYWLVDGGGPHVRHVRQGPHDFVFPQQQQPPRHPSSQHAVQPTPGMEWRANFVDYLFLAFNTSTAFSPTDTLVLSRRAKVLMMIQSATSMLTIAMLAARAINIIA